MMTEFYLGANCPFNEKLKYKKHVSKFRMLHWLQGKI